MYLTTGGTMYGIIYKSLCTVNSKCYIGQTTRTLSRRRVEHQNQAKNNSRSCKYFHNALMKYGFDKFVWTVEYSAKTKEELNQKEQEFIIVNNSFGENGYNLCFGGNSNAGYKHTRPKKGFKHTLEERKRISKRMLGRKLSEDTKEKIRKANFGKKASKKTKRKMSESNKGKGTKSVICTTTGTIYSSLTEASIDLDLNIAKISLVVNGKRNHTKGYQFEYTKRI